MGCGRLLWFGAVPAAWSLADLAAPLAIGWLGQVLVGAWSHLLPNIGPGDGPAHARARQILGRGARVRVAALNIGVALLLVGVLLRSDPTVVVGFALAVGSGVAAVGALFWVAIAARSGDLAGPQPTRP